MKGSVEETSSITDYLSSGEAPCRLEGESITDES
jgi:hypothetical protein